MAGHEILIPYYLGAPNLIAEEKGRSHVHEFRESQELRVFRDFNDVRSLKKLKDLCTRKTRCG